LAWRNIMASIVRASLDYVGECLGTDPSECARRLIASADAVYSPLRPVDSGFGEARKIASTLASIIANAFISMAESKLGGDALTFLGEVAARLREEAKTGETFAREVLERAGAGLVEPSVSKEARESLVSDIVEYVEPPQPATWRRRRSPPRRPDPRQRLRRLLRELGRRDPLLARELGQLLRSLGVPA